MIAKPKTRTRLLLKNILSGLARLIISQDDITNTLLYRHDFSKIRYVVRNNDKTICKNVNDFANDYEGSEEKKTHIDFLRKYLELTKCDLFFADKVILVEGATERIYIPFCINLLTNKNDHKFTLGRQYYTIIEVGGAYGYIFIPFLRFLQTPSLIITDIDSIDATGHKCMVSVGIGTSNSTIKHWFEDEIKKATWTFEDVKNLSKNEKIRGDIAISYQTTDNGIIGRTLEPAIMISNNKTYNIVKESDLPKQIDKMNFILSIISADSTGHNIPSYIKEGLTWLNGK